MLNKGIVKLFMAYVLLIHFSIGRKLKVMLAIQLQKGKAEGEETLTILSHLDIH